MGILHSPVVSDFETKEQAESYDRWFREKVREAMDDPRPGIPHDEVMAEMDAVIAAAQARKKTKQA
ncbi:stability determinant [Pseudomonas lundensis]|uniref:type II toxin-antitoxin system RelB family antitoxin n=1 Tax=Serratia proteamaculans TaxID=28151 RepID=UPI0029811CAB|nr:stability determinant [Serratia proteamaculans]MDW5501451.1 stability determinant [Serratia proteamaculans]MDW5506516.1 stability determinant [Pseudomonas lundensis]